MVQEILGEYPSGKAVVYYNAVRQTIDLAKAFDYYAFYHTATDKIIVLQWFRSEGRTIHNDDDNDDDILSGYEVS